MVKPFSAVEVVARVQAILRRTAGMAPDRLIRVGALEIDPESYIATVRSGDQINHLDTTLTEFRLLEFMARHPMRVFSRGELADACLPNEDALDRTVDSHISKLRRKLTAAGMEKALKGVRGVGYRLNAR